MVSTAQKCEGHVTSEAAVYCVVWHPSNARLRLYSVRGYRGRRAEARIVSATTCFVMVGAAVSNRRREEGITHIRFATTASGAFRALMRGFWRAHCRMTVVRLVGVWCYPVCYRLETRSLDMMLAWSQRSSLAVLD